jgi:hypothetical protein
VKTAVIKSPEVGVTRDEKQWEDIDRLEQAATGVLHAKETGEWPPKDWEFIVLALAQWVVWLAQLAKQEQELRISQENLSRALLKHLPVEVREQFEDSPRVM